MSKTVNLEDEEIEILLSYHKERLANVSEQVQSLLEKKDASEKRLQELAGAHESEAPADEEPAEPEMVHETAGEAEAEIISEEPADDQPEQEESATEEPVAEETEHAGEAEPVTVSGETSEEHADEPEIMSEEPAAEEAEAEMPVAETEHEEPVAEETEAEAPVAEAEHEEEPEHAAAEEYAAMPEHQDNGIPHKGVYP